MYRPQALTDTSFRVNRNDPRVSFFNRSTLMMDLEQTRWIRRRHQAISTSVRQANTSSNRITS
jgi:hypothetical protein